MSLTKFYKAIEIIKDLVYNNSIKFEEEKSMADFFNELEKILSKIWDAIYVLLCDVLGGEVNEDWFISKETEE